jgi:hypothetical protein
MLGSAARVRLTEVGAEATKDSRAGCDGRHVDREQSRQTAIASAIEAARTRESAGPLEEYVAAREPGPASLLLTVPFGPVRCGCTRVPCTADTAAAVASDAREPAMTWQGNSTPTASRWGRTAALRDSYQGWKSALWVVLPFVIVAGVLAVLFLLPGRAH